MNPNKKQNPAIKVIPFLTILLIPLFYFIYVKKFKHKHFDYKNTDKWKNSFKTCDTSKGYLHESPVDINTKYILKKLLYNYSSSVACTIINNGHTIQINVPRNSNYVEIGGIKFELIQFHFHHPSEHTFDGNQRDMEMHLVHKSTVSEKLAVIGITIKQTEDLESASSIQLQKIFKILPKINEENKIKDVNIQNFIPKSNNLYIYEGSLTTPPCTENVLWIVYDKEISISKQGINNFAKLYPKNARSIQRKKVIITNISS